MKTGTEYTLKETAAPEGYTVAADTTFTIDETGKITSSGTVTEDGVLLVENSPDKHVVKVFANPAAGGTVSGGGTYAHGAGVTVTAVPESGYEFVNWTENGKPVSTEETYAFNANAERDLKANFRLKTFTITFKDASGKTLLTAEYPYGTKPEDVAAPDAPVKSGTAQYTYTFAGWVPEIGTVEGDAVYTPVYTASVNTYRVTWIIDGISDTRFYAYGETPYYPIPEKPARPFTVFLFEGWSPEVVPVTKDATYTAVFRELRISFIPPKPVIPGAGQQTSGENSLPFVDVDPTTDLYNAVKYVFERNIMNGVSKTEFDPVGPLTRGMMVTILHRMEGKPSVEGIQVFADVPTGKWYSDAVEWAASVGIVKGYGDGNYGPDDELTREQLAAILNRYAEYKGYKLITAELAPSVTDASEISGWAVENVKWAVFNGILTPDRSGKLRPAESASRAEIAFAIRAFLENVAP